VNDIPLLVGLIAPLALDTFALAAALGVAGLPPDERRRTSLILAGFEAGMPIVGAFAGGALGDAIGPFAGWTAIAFLLFAGVLMLRPRSEGSEAARLRLLARARGLSIIDLGIAISVDELAIGFGLGLLGLALPLAVIWIGAQAFIAAQLGLRLGSRIGERLRERAELLSGVVLIGIALALALIKLL
jgi:putative Mn2+ efflux pump MntP